jgi:hypothetical protein
MGLRSPYLPKIWVYPLSRDLTKAYEFQKYDGLQFQESAHFMIKYHDEDKAIVPMVTAAAEQAYEPVTRSLGYTPVGKATIIIMVNRQEMQKSLGWSADQSAMGVFWAGMIQVLSPRAWMNGDSAVAQTDSFIKNGPLAHEFTHLIVDLIARGNYPRWFTEGIAQYQEYRLNGYEWITPNNTLQSNLYTLADMEQDFDGLPNQSLAYRESFAAVRYVYEVYGDESVRAILEELKRGKTMRLAIKTVLHMEYPQYEAAWQQWARANMSHPQR